MVVEKAKKLIPEMHYDARVNCVTNWYGHEKKIAMPKKRARKRLLTREQYLKVGIFASLDFTHDYSLLSFLY